MNDMPPDTVSAADKLASLPQPTVREIVTALDAPTGKVTWCVQPDGTRREPHELWIEGIAAWIRVDGSRGQYALRGTARFIGLDRQRIHSACRRWIKRNGG